MQCRAYVFEWQPVGVRQGRGILPLVAQPRTGWTPGRMELVTQARAQAEVEWHQKAVMDWETMMNRRVTMETVVYRRKKVMVTRKALMIGKVE